MKQKFHDISFRVVVRDALSITNVAVYGRGDYYGAVAEVVAYIRLNEGDTKRAIWWRRKDCTFQPSRLQFGSLEEAMHFILRTRAK